MAVTIVTATAAELVANLSEAFDAFSVSLDTAQDDFNKAPEGSPHFPPNYPEELNELQHAVSLTNYLISLLVDVLDEAGLWGEN